MKPEPSRISDEARAKLFRFARKHDAARRSIRAWLNTKKAVTRDEQHAILDHLEVSTRLKLLFNRQILRELLGLPIEIENVLSTAETAMLRACALKEQLCGGHAETATANSKLSQSVPRR